MQRAALGLRERGEHAGPSRPTTTAFNFSIATRFDREWGLFSKKNSPAETETPAPCAFRCRGPQPAWLHNEPHPPDLLRRHVCVRSPDRRGGDPRDRCDRRRQSAPADHRQGKQGAAGTALPKPVLFGLRRLWKSHKNRRWLFPTRAGTNPIGRGTLVRTLRRPASGERRRRTVCATVMPAAAVEDDGDPSLADHVPHFASSRGKASSTQHRPPR